MVHNDKRHRIAMKNHVGSTLGSFLSVAMFCTLATSTVDANDSSAELATGGLVFVKNADIQMLSEDLFISADEIRVRYRFLNRSSRDITLQVAFPLPDLKVDPVDDTTVVPTDDPVNFVGFATTADGQPVHANVEQKVYVNGRDQTEAFSRLGIPLSPYLAQDVLSKLPKAESARLTRLGLINQWTLKTTFYWQQQFAAGRETIIEHRYKPSVGTTVPVDGASLVGLLMGADYRKYCIDADFLAALAKARGKAFSQQRIEYVLKTGANWAGPINDFRLVVDKGSPNNLVSFCGQGVRRIGPVQFEMRKSDFIPQQDVAVLILKLER
jgi:hypothetical protein